MPKINTVKVNKPKTNYSAGVKPKIIIKERDKDLLEKERIKAINRVNSRLRSGVKHYNVDPKKNKKVINAMMNPYKTPEGLTKTESGYISKSAGKGLSAKETELFIKSLDQSVYSIRQLNKNVWEKKKSQMKRELRDAGRVVPRTDKALIRAYRNIGKPEQPSMVRKGSKKVKTEGEEPIVVTRYGPVDWTYEGSLTDQQWKDWTVLNELENKADVDKEFKDSFNEFYEIWRIYFSHKGRTQAQLDVGTYNTVDKVNITNEAHQIANMTMIDKDTWKSYSYEEKNRLIQIVKDFNSRFDNWIADNDPDKIMWGKGEYSDQIALEGKFEWVDKESEHEAGPILVKDNGKLTGRFEGMDDF